MSDTTDNQVLAQAANDPVFQNRCRLRFITAAVSITNEVGTTPSHANRLALAGAIFNGTISNTVLCLLVLSNATVRTSVLAAPTQAGGNSLDSDIDTQIASVFTGVAVSRAW